MNVGVLPEHIFGSLHLSYNVVKLHILDIVFRQIVSERY